ncbi:unnamed protein product [Chondrus crispus]|uniref:Uncharacterized protein n=1 Tax=Chondrus crispus TaxID=2769 RepID=R7QNG4_CHOCR|nr:unnamed protein product [Chondrus crispus]CDF38996.1 unnamed protein product [Chondrus crispus]|eukprot:XP_005718901.1 unnamed protein product [Chondrus crispus]
MPKSSYGTRPIAVVTGASRGLGRALASHLSAQGYLVIAGQRAPAPKSCNFDIRHLRLDLADEDSLEAFCHYLLDNLPCIDVLVNNAASCPDHPGDTAKSASYWNSVLQVNFFASVRLTESLLPLLQQSLKYPRVVNISSGDGELLFFSESLKPRLERLEACNSTIQLIREVESIANNILDDSFGIPIDELIYNGQPAYKLSKALLNGYTRFASRRQERLQSPEVAFVSVCPGDVDTEMADFDAILISPEDAVWRLASVLVASKPCKTGVFLREGKEISW